MGAYMLHGRDKPTFYGLLERVTQPRFIVKRVNIYMSEPHFIYRRAGRCPPL